MNHTHGHRPAPASPAGPWHGFTLVELLVVIGIIALLIGILLPALNSARLQARTAACLSNQRQIVMAVMLYANDNKNYLPSYGHFSLTYAENPDCYWWRTLSPYVKRGDTKNGWLGMNIMRCPAEQDATRFGTYGVNYGYTNKAAFAYSMDNHFRPDYDGSLRLGRVKAGVFLTADTISWRPGGGDVAIYNPQGFPLDTDTDGDGIKDTCSLVYSAVDPAPYNHLSPRHPKKNTICSFPDGSARVVTLKDWVTNVDGIWGP